MRRLCGWLKSLVFGLMLCSDRAAAAPTVAGFERFGRQAADRPQVVESGLLLLGELGCVNCHVPQPSQAVHLLPKRGPSLDRVGERLDPQWIAAYLKDPRARVPHTTMPHALAAVPASSRDDVAAALTHFLASTGQFGSATSAARQPGNAAEGAAIFNRIGCAACHGRRDAASLLPDQIPLHGLEAKWDPSSLDRFLRDPLSVRPSSRMPALAMNDHESSHLVASLLGRSPGPNDKLRDVVAFNGRGWTFAPESLASLELKEPPSKEGQVRGFDVAGFMGTPRDFVVRCEGFLHAPMAGIYRFNVLSDDGSRLVIGDQTVVDNDGVHPAVDRQGEIRLEAGVHPIRLDYFQGGGDQVLALDVTPPGNRRQSALLFITPTKDGTPARDGAAAEEAFVLDPALVERGREAFAAVGCANCHDLEAADGRKIASTATVRPLADLGADRGCLAAARKPGTGPDYGLDASQRAAIVAAFEWLASPTADEPPPRERQIVRTMTALNCYACHVRDGRGGTELAVPQTDDDGEPITRDAARDALFTSMVQELGDEGRLPPTLTGVGDKLNRQFLHDVLVKGNNDRHMYMHTRMPSWHAAVAEPLAALLAADATTEGAPPALAGHPAEDVVDAGRFLVGSKALGCIKCHAFTHERGQSLGVVPMTRFPARLRHEWFLAYVADPQRFRPGTRMPASWPEGKVFFKDVLDGSPAGQIEAVWRYVSSREPRPPVGINGEPMELVAAERPVIYRNFIKDAGPRAIGVGYPEKVNIAWDAEALRLALVWKGGFIDAGMHWSGRGAGWQPPLGDGLFTPEKVAPLAVLDKADAPWPDTPIRERGGKFRGYSLDAAGRPTFKWSLAGMEVRESFEPVNDSGKPLLRRTILLRGQPEGGATLFRAVSADRIEELGDGWMRIDGFWRIRVQSPGEPAKVQAGNKTEIRYPIAWAVASVPPGGTSRPAEAIIVEELSW